MRGSPVAISSARAGLLSIAQPRTGRSVRGLLTKELTDGVGISNLQTAYDGTWLAIRNCGTNLSTRINSWHEFVHADQLAISSWVLPSKSRRTTEHRRLSTGIVGV